MLLFIVSLLACGTANISWGRVLAMGYLITLCAFIFYLHVFLFLYFYFITRFPRLLYMYQRGLDCTAWWISPCVGVSLCVDVRLRRVSSCTWRVGQSWSSLWGVRTCGSVSPPVLLLYFSSCSLYSVS